MVSSPVRFCYLQSAELEGLPDNGAWIAAIDASFLPKTGCTSYCLSWFCSGSQGKAEHGLEISLLALVDVTHNTAYTLSVYQTPALPKVPKISEVAKESTVNTGAQDAESNYSPHPPLKKGGYLIKSPLTPVFQKGGLNDYGWSTCFS